MKFLWSLVLSVQLLFLYSPIIVTICFSFIQPMQCHEDESHALLQFKEDFIISESASYNPFSYPKIASWNATTECCSWDGIKCDEHTGHVIGVDLSSSQLYGYMNSNSTLFSLVHLQRLDLADNDFNYSQIPSKIGELSQLRYLNLSHTNFYGEIPSQVSHLSKLLFLDLSNNYNSNLYPTTVTLNLLQLKMSILRSIVQNSTKLAVLRLSYVTISSSLPDFFTNLTSLQELYLSNCELYGQLPVGIFHLPNLISLVLKYNQNLTGSLPDFHSNSLRLLELEATSFYGTLPASIGKLSSLTWLSISGCNFFGSIPSSLSNLTQLRYIDLEYNKFRGDLSSSLANLTQLSHLAIGFNEFNLETISWIGKLSTLTYLHLSSVNISSQIPSSFANLTRLEHLDASTSNISGEIPSWIMNLTKLAHLDLQGNNLHGEIPHSLFRLENLACILLGYNLLHGKLELDMILKIKIRVFVSLPFNKLSVVSGKSSSNVTGCGIHVLDLASCNLVEFPTILQDLNDLGSLWMSDNSISSLPSWLWTKESLQSLTVSNNLLTGEISPSICNLKSLMHLDLSFNNLGGNIPSCLGNFSQSLQILKLQGNKLSGLIPQTYMEKNSLKMIDFSNNSLQGQLPRALVNCVMLEFLDVSQNHINDSFPFWLGDLPELKVMALRANRFYGAIRCPVTKTCAFPKIHIIDLSHNEFSGKLPLEMFQSWKSMKDSNTSQLQYEQWYLWYLQKGQYWTEYNTYSFTMSNKGMMMVYTRLQQFFIKMIAIDISSNRISGEIPEVIGDLKGLVLLNLSNNMLTGRIPSSLGKLSNLEALDLSHNSLSGKIPQQLTQLTFLSFFNVSYNNLSGPVPQNKQFSTFSGNSYEGNQGLCGDQLSKKCEEYHPGSHVVDDQDLGSSLEFDWKVVVIGYIGGLVVGVALGSTFSPEIFAWLKRVC